MLKKLGIIVKQATLKIYEGAGHGLTITLKDRLNDDLLEFCRADGALAAPGEVA